MSDRASLLLTCAIMAVLTAATVALYIAHHDCKTRRCPELKEPRLTNHGCRCEPNHYYEEATP